MFKKLAYILAKKILTKFGYFNYGFPLYFMPDAGMGSHKKYFKFLLSKLEKENLIIIEIGSGNHSSKLFSKQVRSFSGKFISFENNHEWHLKIKNKFKNRKNTEFLFLDKLNKENIKSELDNLNIEKISLSFIDSEPWESRTEALELLKTNSKIVAVHDVDYFPRNNLWGVEIEPIKNKPINRYFYGKLKAENLGLRNYDSIFEYWVEIFPLYSGYYTGPPILVGSNFIDVRKIFDRNKPKGHYFFST
mgnify:CR=1 FL=1|tara:strand:+ start:845 stop:1588 length:744 start_codon:yes stop_codon:yes gene_type:complete